MDWYSARNGFKTYLRLEKGLALNTISAYLHDFDLLQGFLCRSEESVSPKHVGIDHLREFIKHCATVGLSARSQARIISGFKCFFKYVY